ncbi:MAG: fluoride efflux transporter CrcB [Clostridiales bacterium]|nr:fluoride efflux transporter CrcB [Candidatus Cacconaster stercorequi]
MLNCIFVGLGGFLGSVLRYLVGLIPLETAHGFPVKTLCINVAGAFAIGLIAALAAREGQLDPRAVLFWKVGVCGGFTTFSTFAYETGALTQNGNGAWAAAYVILSVALGVAAVLAAQALMK